MKKTELKFRFSTSEILGIRMFLKEVFFQETKLKYYSYHFKYYQDMGLRPTGLFWAWKCHLPNIFLSRQVEWINWDN